MSALQHPVLSDGQIVEHPLSHLFTPVKPSPRPWTQVDNGWELWDADEQSIACVGSGEVTKHADAQARVDAEHIVTCVNAHDDLVDALFALLYACDSPALIVQARAALKKAGNAAYNQARSDELNELKAALAKAGR